MILDTAKTVFARQGYNAANVAELCAAARIGRGTLYVYFENKRAVLIALLEEVVDRIVAVLGRRTALTGMSLNVEKADVRSIVAFCERRTREILQAVFVDEATLRIVLREARGLDGVVDKVIAKIDRGMLTALESDIEEAQRLGILKPGDATLLARYSLGGIEKVILLALLGDEPIDLEKVVRQTVGLQLFGLLSDTITQRGGRTS